MPLKYKVVATKKPGQGKDGETIYFPRLTNTEQVDLHGLAEILSKRSTASGADVFLIIQGLMELVPELLLNGNTVKLDDFGTFRLHAKVATADSANAVTAKNIKSVRISFLPDKRMKKPLKDVSFTKLS